jgi:hypothetical protein
MKAPKRAKTEPSISSGGSLVLNAGLPFRPEGIYGEGVISIVDARSNGTGEVPPPRYPLKKGWFLGGPGGFPRAQLDYSTTSQEHVTNEN